MRIFRKAMEWILRAEIYMMGFRRTTIIGVDMALNRRGLKDALTYSGNTAIMILHKNRTVCIPWYKIDHRNWYAKEFDFVDYVYEELEPENWQ